jgi:trehalose/maltose hydrolase-like predicted phosphorylase
MFPFQSAGVGTCVDSFPPANVLEVHVIGVVAWFAEQYWFLTKDISWLEEQGRDLASGIAQYWASRVVPTAGGGGGGGGGGNDDGVQTGGGGGCSIAAVGGPDEYGAGLLDSGGLESGVTDSVFTNSIARRSLRFALAVNASNGSAALAGRWANVAANITVLFDKATQTHPEYQDFPKYNNWVGKAGVVKQADVVLLEYPLGEAVPAHVRANDLAFYGKLYDPKGPCMTHAMTAIGWLSAGEPAAAHAEFAATQENAQRPFNVWTESPSPNQHASLDDAGCYNFLTGAGGWLQSLTNGYGGIRNRETGVHFDLALPSGASSIKFRGLAYVGRKYSVLYEGQVASVCLEAAAGVGGGGDGASAAGLSVTTVPKNNTTKPSTHRLEEHGQCATFTVPAFVVHV